MMSFYRTNLILNFVPYVGKDHRGFSQYSKNKFLSTSINYEGAAFFYLTAMPILNGEDSEKQIEAALPCSNNAALLFEYKPDQSGQMSAYLTVNKNNEMIPFRFSTHPYRVNIDGNMVTKVRQAGLGAFAMTLESYLKGIGADLHLNKLTEEELDDQQVPSSAWGGGQ
jgi:hypothetical protein